MTARLAHGSSDDPGERLADRVRDPGSPRQRCSAARTRAQPGRRPRSIDRRSQPRRRPRPGDDRSPNDGGGVTGWTGGVRCRDLGDARLLRGTAQLVVRVSEGRAVLSRHPW